MRESTCKLDVPTLDQFLNFLNQNSCDFKTVTRRNTNTERPAEIRKRGHHRSNRHLHGSAGSAAGRARESDPRDATYYSAPYVAKHQPVWFPRTAFARAQDVRRKLRVVQSSRCGNDVLFRSGIGARARISASNRLDTFSILTHRWVTHVLVSIPYCPQFGNVLSAGEDTA
ncbi:hypothetical protein EVAR_21028_1 [Eumeta japonica]|uniref:Uncharacterized protein n=1 Tax=Eumeta variegata TaxID=151549 RepID=A0A4C1UZV1_EUMVA|nr:hypothetical protein EVAR_21028_1 [Eumeta japonica]